MRDGRVSVSAAASKDGIVKDLEYYGFDGVDPAAIEVSRSRAATHSVILDVRNNMGEMQHRSVYNKVAIDSVSAHLLSPSSVTVVLTPLKPYFKDVFTKEIDYMNIDTWKNKGKDLLNESLAKFGLQTKSIGYDQHYNHLIGNYDTQYLNVALERLNGEA